MKTTICIFEDSGYKNFLPLTYLRPVYELRGGIFTLREKIERYFVGYPIIYQVRSEMENLYRSVNPKFRINDFTSEEIIFINGRIIIDTKIASIIKKMPCNSSLKTGDVLIALRVVKKYIQPVIEDSKIGIESLAENLPSSQIETTLLKYPWDIVNSNGVEIRNDFQHLRKRTNSKSFKNVVQKNKKSIHISSGVDIDPFVHLDASEGPILLGKNVKIFSHSYIQGPAFIGDNSIVKAHTAIYHDSSIGPTCKVGGEIESSIIHSCSNKQHAGFLGHSYLGSWVNLGAGTNNSDLKNNYTNIAVLLNGKTTNTDSQFVGLIMGDHSKTAIDTSFNTGTIVGVSCNIFGGGFPPRYIPSFSWGGSDFLRTYDIEKSLEVAKIVMNRRENELSKDEELLLRKIFEDTRQERVKKS